MKFARTLGSVAAVTAMFVAALFAHGRPAHGLAYQTTTTVVNKPAADIADVYLFPSPTNSQNVVAVMDVYPGIPAGSGLGTYFFDQTVLYTMKFDRKYPNAESVGSGPVEDLVMQFSVGAPGNNSQQILFYGLGAPSATGATTTLLGGGAAVATGPINTTFSGGNGITIFTGVRADPNFFDQAQYFKIFPDRQRGATTAGCLPGTGNGSCPGGFTNPGSDFYAATNVLSIVAEFPKSFLTPASGSLGKVAFWATTSTTTGS